MPEVKDRTVETEVPKAPKAPKPKPPTFDRLRKKKPVTKRLKVYLEDHPQPDQHEFWPPGATPTEAQKALYEQAYKAWQDRMDADSTVIVLQGTGRRHYGEILDAHPATDEQIEQAKKRGIQAPDFDPLTFAPALIQASLVEPELTLEQVQELFDEWNQGEMTRVYLAALEVNTGSKVEDFSNVSAMMPF